MTIILTLILFTNQFVAYLNKAASGSIPAIFVLRLIAFEMPNLLSILLPFSFYISIILTYGHLYCENEMLVLQSCGFSSARLLFYSLLIASCIVFIVTFLVYINPGMSAKRVKLLDMRGAEAFIQTLSPKHFHSFSNTPGQVIYMDSINRARTSAKDLFIAQMNLDGAHRWRWQIITAKNLKFLKKSNEPAEILLDKGQIYRLSFKNLNDQYGVFEKLSLKLPLPTFDEKLDLRNWPFKKLWQKRKESPSYNAEIQWRFSIVIMAWVLTFIAVPICRISPRKGKFSKLLPAILVFLAYIEALFYWREQLAWGYSTGNANLLLVDIITLLISGFLFWLYGRRLI